MPKQNNKEQEMLQTAAKLVARIIRKQLKNNTLDWTVQFSISNMDPEVQYSVMISEPAKGVQPIIFSFTNYEALMEALKGSETKLVPLEVEKAFHSNRINTYENKIAAHRERMEKIEKGEVEDEEEIEMEKV